MRKLATIALISGAMLISACSNINNPGNEDYSGWNDYNFNNQTVNSILIPGQARYYQQGSDTSNYRGKTSRQYYVTKQDQQDYDTINSRIQQHQQQIQQGSSTNNVSSSDTSTIPSVSANQQNMNH